MRVLYISVFRGGNQLALMAGRPTVFTNQFDNTDLK